MSSSLRVISRSSLVLPASPLYFFPADCCRLKSMFVVSHGVVKVTNDVLLFFFYVLDLAS